MNDNNNRENKGKRKVRYVNRHEPFIEDYYRIGGNQYLLGLRFGFAMTLHLLICSLKLITPYGLLITALSIFLTACCYYAGFTTDLPINLLASTIIFPFSFSLSYSLNRRDQSLIDMGSFKSSAYSLYRLFRDWNHPVYLRRMAVRSEQAAALRRRQLEAET